MDAEHPVLNFTSCRNPCRTLAQFTEGKSKQAVGAAPTSPSSWPGKWARVKTQLGLHEAARGGGEKLGWSPPFPCASGEQIKGTSL